MINNYFNTASRNLGKSKLYSFVNIFGLALGMAACFFIFQYIYFESRYDSFHKNAANIYRVPISYTGSFSDVGKTATNHPAVGPNMKSSFPEVIDFTRLAPSSLFLASSTFTFKQNNGSDEIFTEDRFYFADSSFFTIFSFPFVAGDPAKALTQANTIAISESTAKKYFNNENPLGKTLRLNGIALLKVTGVFRDVPENSHLRFDMIASFLTLPPFGYDQAWAWPEYYNYVLLTPGADPKKVEARFPAFIDKRLGSIMKEYNFGSQFYMQPLLDIHLHSNLLKEASANGSQTEITFLSIIGVFILVIAWINYINLSTVKSMERAKEVGLRKVVGASRRQIITQFLFESTLINAIALVVAVLLVFFFTPMFNRFIGKNINQDFLSNGLGSEWLFWIGTVLIFAVGALLVGSYPAFILSAFRPVKVLKGVVVKSNSRMSLRRTLVSFQFILSIILIAATLIVYIQLSYMRTQQLGYKKDQVLVIKSPGVTDSTIADKFRYFQNEMLRNPAIAGMAPSSDIPGKRIMANNGMRRVVYDKTHNLSAFQMEIDENFQNTFDIKLAAGRNFTITDTSFVFFGKQPVRVLINEALARLLGYDDSKDAINQQIVMGYLTGEVTCEIIGVTSNYHQRSLKEKYDPILYYYPAWNNWKYFSVSLKTDMVKENLSAIEAAYKASFPGNPFEYFFLDDFFNQQYQSDQRLGNIFGLFAVFAIIIASMGLLGLSAFVIRVRTKEIGIRKVLGASMTSIMTLFSKDFVKLVAIASVIAVPVVYFFATKWLNNYAFRIRISWWILLLPPLILLIITLITICLQSLKAVSANPIRALRSE